LITCKRSNIGKFIKYRHNSVANQNSYTNYNVSSEHNTSRNIDNYMQTPINMENQLKTHRNFEKFMQTPRNIDIYLNQKISPPKKSKAITRNQYDF